MFKVLNIGDSEWVSRVMGLGISKRDIHFDARMLAPYVAAYKWKAHLAVSETDDGYIVQPILVTSDNLIRHSYNFGGPMGSSDTLSSKEHSDGLSEWCIKNNITSEYCTLNPFLIKDQLRLISSSPIDPQYRKQSVIVDLNDQKVRGTTRRLASKAQGVGVTVKSYDPITHLEIFYEMYKTTMERVKAKDHWNFSFNWFQAFNRFLKPQLLLAEFEGKFESGCLVVYSQQYPVAYYHFAGSFGKFPTLGINHMLVLAACDFIKSIGIRYLYLGGGITDKDEDSLFVFKAGFSKDRMPVYTYSRSYVADLRQIH